MEKNKEEHVKKSAADNLNVNLWLLSVLFTIFTFLIATNSQLLRDNNLIAIQLTLAIPLMMTSIFARQRLVQAEKRLKEWKKYGFITFVLAYAFLINSIGIMLAFSINIQVSLFFFLMNIVNPIIYSYMEIKDDNKVFWSRFYKDLFFIMIIIILGILPSLGIIK